jgi:NAD(P)-dependent dehydrogenase (short-subunit alcohol dehydrogenase family)
MIKYDFSGRVAVVTGAGGGMGLALSEKLLEAGASVLAIDVKDRPASLSEGARLTYAQGDLTDPAFVTTAIEGAYAKFGRIDYLANIAGVLLFDKDVSLLDIDLDVWDRVMAINLKSMVHTMRAAVPLMRKSGNGGAMVHFGTIQCLRGDSKPQDAYVAGKLGVVAMSKSMAMQLAAEGIRSNVIHPGVTLSPMQERWSEEDKKAFADYVPMKRVGRTSDMADAAMFLLSDAASYVTGTEMIVDGGLMLKY